MYDLGTCVSASTQPCSGGQSPFSIVAIYLPNFTSLGIVSLMFVACRSMFAVVCLNTGMTSHRQYGARLDTFSRFSQINVSFSLYLTDVRETKASVQNIRCSAVDDTV